MIWGCENITTIYRDTPIASPAFIAGTTVQGIFGDPKARVVSLLMAGEKTGCAVLAARSSEGGTIASGVGCGILRGVAIIENYLEIEVRRIDCSRCLKVKQEKLGVARGQYALASDLPSSVGRRCRATTIKDVAQETHLDGKPSKNWTSSTCASKRVGWYSNSQGHSG